MNGSGDQSESVAQSLRQATQLLLRAAERLEQTPSVAPSATSSAPSVDAPGSSSSGSGARPRVPFLPARRRNVPKYRPYLTTLNKKWQHTFVCLSQVHQFMPPDTADRVRLVQAGLGEKKISCSLEATAEELHQTLLEAYPRLRNGGGYEFLKIDEGSRKSFSVVPSPAGGYTPHYLKAIFLQAKIFVRPLQKCLDITPLVEQVSY